MCSFLFSSCRNNFSEGERIYMNQCANCHQTDGSGLAKLIPSLQNNPLIIQVDQKLICTIRNGINADSFGLTLRYMPAHQKLTEVEMTNLVNYLKTKWRSNGTTVKEYNLNEVKIFMNKCSK
jgi:cytochrome c551